MRRIEFSDSARKFLIKSDKNLSKKLLEKIELLNKNPERLQIKKLKGEKGVFRIRSGDYRIIFEIYDDEILITKIGNRKDIYK